MEIFLIEGFFHGNYTILTIVNKYSSKAEGLS